MHRKAIRYKDTWAAPGSELFAALEAGDSKKAHTIYINCEARLRMEQLWTQGYTDVPKDVLDLMNFEVAPKPEPCYSLCSLGVGCDEVGMCYAEAHGEPSQCGAKTIS